MSTGWSIWILFLAGLNLSITLFLFIWSQKVKIPTQEDGTTGHVWAHGVLRESVRKLPLWWAVISAGAFIFAFVYLAMFPSFGKHEGVLKWSSEERLARETDANMQHLQPLLDRALASSLNELAADPQAITFGKRVFDDNCAACHGYDGKGNKVVGAPDLTIGAWLYGGDDEALLHTVRQGREGLMPGWGHLGIGHVKNLAHYVQSLAGLPHESASAAAGKVNFDRHCVLCHGPEGKGNIQMNAPDITGNRWAYGNSLDEIRATITLGRHGVMPAWEGRLSDAEIRLVTAWVRHHELTDEQ